MSHLKLVFLTSVLFVSTYSIGASASTKFLFQSVTDVNQFRTFHYDGSAKTYDLVIGIPFNCKDCFKETVSRVKSLIRNQQRGLRVTLLIRTNWEKGRDALFDAKVGDEFLPHFYTESSARFADAYKLGKDGYILLDSYGRKISGGTMKSGFNAAAIESQLRR